jgi:hypothetical protein
MLRHVLGRPYRDGILHGIVDADHLGIGGKDARVIGRPDKREPENAGRQTTCTKITLDLMSPTQKLKMRIFPFMVSKIIGAVMGSAA